MPTKVVSDILHEALGGPSAMYRIDTKPEGTMPQSTPKEAISHRNFAFFHQTEYESTFKPR